MVVLSAATLNIPHYSSFIILFPIWSTTWGVFSCMFPLPSGGMPHFQTYPKPPQNVGKNMCCPILLPFSSIFPHVLWGHSSSFEGPKATCWQRCFFVSARRPTPGGDFTGGWSCSRGWLDLFMAVMQNTQQQTYHPGWFIQPLYGDGVGSLDLPHYIRPKRGTEYV